jgi:glucans biosynthesis protein C
MNESPPKRLLDSKLDSKYLLDPVSKISIAIDNLRGLVVVMVLAFHSSMAYLTSQPPSQPAFDSAAWTADPIVDNARWLPLDLFSAFQFLYLMQLMFFLSGLFAWPSLQRKRPSAFLFDRALRLGAPFVLGTLLLMPAAYYPVYRVTAIDPGLPAFLHHWIALPFWPDGPMWFLWFLLVLDAVAAALFRFFPRTVEALSGLAAANCASPSRFFIALVTASSLAYLPAALTFQPWQWTEFGPFAFQPGFVPQYIVYFFAGLVIGANGLEGSFARSDGKLPLRASAWTAGTFASFALWLTGMALIVKGPAPQFLGLHFAADAAVVLFVACTLLAAIALCLRFAGTQRRILKTLSENGYGIFVFHYVFVLWTQYFLLGTAMFAPFKAVIVLGVTLALSWTASVLVCRTRIGARVLKGERLLRLTPGSAVQKRGWLSLAPR